MQRETIINAIDIVRDYIKFAESDQDEKNYSDTLEFYRKFHDTSWSLDRLTCWVSEDKRLS